MNLLETGSRGGRGREVSGVIGRRHTYALKRPDFGERERHPRAQQWMTL